MTRAPITPGIQPKHVSKVTRTIDPHPLSKTASGGKMIANITRNKDIVILVFNEFYCFSTYFDEIKTGTNMFK